ncbi:MAG: hypothetical protein GXP63_03705 [DPANN group archaeon]|nr:hypothetical protein [DPANN group archaeon]
MVEEDLSRRFPTPVPVIISAVMAVFLLWLFGWYGLLGFVVLLLLYVMPGYTLLDLLKLSRSEKAFLAFPLGLLLVSLGTFWLNLVIGSMRWSAVITVVMIMTAGILLKTVRR